MIQTPSNTTRPMPHIHRSNEKKERRQKELNVTVTMLRLYRTMQLHPTMAPTRVAALLAFGSNPVLSYHEVQFRTGLSKRTVSEVISDLVELGYVERPGRGQYKVTGEGLLEIVNLIKKYEANAGQAL